MVKSRTSLAIVVVVLAILAVAIGLYGLLVWQRSDVALTGAILLLGLAQLLSLFWPRRDAARQPPDSQEDGARQREREQFADAVRRLDQLGADDAALAAALEQLQERLAAIESFAVAPPPSPSPPLEHPVHEIDDAFSTHAARASGPAPTMMRGLPQSPVELFLEPVVRMREARTVYYRASLAELGTDGTYVSVRKSPALDFECFRQVVPVARRFRARNRIIGIFCPLSPASFSDDEFIARLLELLREEHDVAGGLVVDITQKGLASLEESGLEGLAWLAELGATFCLSHTDVAGPDIPALSHLGFQFIDIDAAIITRSAGSSSISVREPALKLFHEAGEHGVTVIAANVAQERELDGLLDYASLARGPFFSPPRRVLHHAGTTTLESAVA